MLPATPLLKKPSKSVLDKPKSPVKQEPKTTLPKQTVIDVNAMAEDDDDFL